MSPPSVAPKPPTPKLAQEAIIILPQGVMSFTLMVSISSTLTRIFSISFVWLLMCKVLDSIWSK